MSDFGELLDAINTKEKLKEQLEWNAKNIKYILNKISIDELESKTLNYDQFNNIYKKIQYHISEERRPEFESLLRRKKIEKFPELLKATYFPEINQLNIPDSEKVRIDEAARVNCRYHMTANNLSRLKYKLSIEDLEMLETVGVVEKLYAICCPCCGCEVTSITQSDFDNYIRYFGLIEKEISDGLSDDEEVEADELFEQGFDAVCTYCDDCEENIEADSLKEFNNLSFNIMYKVVKQPDLTYEKM